MTLTNNIIKIMYVTMGYLPNYPYHMISDKEMVEAFIGEDGYFDSMYYCPGESVREDYDKLKLSIEAVLMDYLQDNIDVIPDWIYSYMLGNTITYSSDVLEIEYLYELTGVKPATSYDTFDENLAQACLSVSKEWLKKQSSAARFRTPTMFGEPHVIKSLRLSAADILNP